MTVWNCLFKLIFNLIKNEDQKDAYPEKVSKQAELFARSIVSILYLKVQILRFSNSKVEIFMLMTNLSMTGLRRWTTRT